MVVFYISFLSFEGWRLKTAIFHLNSPIKKDLIGSISSELFIQGNKFSKGLYIFLNMTVLPTQEFIKRILGVWWKNVKSLVWFGPFFKTVACFMVFFFNEKKGLLTIVYIVRVKGAKSGSKENSLFSRITELGLFPFLNMWQKSLVVWNHERYMLWSNTPKFKSPVLQLRH